MTAESPTLILDSTAIEHLRSARKWSNFISIIGIVLIGIMILIMAAFLLMGSFESSNVRLVGFTGQVKAVPLALMIFAYEYPFTISISLENIPTLPLITTIRMRLAWPLNTLNCITGSWVYW